MKSNIGQGLRSFKDLTSHLTTRTDDDRAVPVFGLLAALSRF